MIIVNTSVVWYSRYLNTYRRYLRDDTSVANVTIYRGIIIIIIIIIIYLFIFLKYPW